MRLLQPMILAWIGGRRSRRYLRPSTWTWFHAIFPINRTKTYNTTSYHLWGEGHAKDEHDSWTRSSLPNSNYYITCKPKEISFQLGPFRSLSKRPDRDPHKQIDWDLHQLNWGIQKADQLIRSNQQSQQLLWNDFGKWSCPTASILTREATRRSTPTSAFCASFSHLAFPCSRRVPEPLSRRQWCL